MDIDDAPPPTILGQIPGKNRRDDLMSQIVEHCRDAVWVIEATSAAPGALRIIYVNDAFETLYDCGADFAVGREVGSFLRTRFPQREVDATLEALGRRKPFELTMCCRRAGAVEEVWLSTNGEPRANAGHIRWYITSRDITQIMAARARAERLARALEYAHEPITVETFFDHDSAIDYVNHAFEKLFGYSSEELVGRSWRSLLAPEADRKRAEDCRAGVSTGQNVRAELPFQRKDGTTIMLQISSTLIAEETDGVTRSAVTVFSDITDRRKEERRLRDQVNRDPLTGLLNRREFERLLESATNMTLPKARAHMLLFLDLDGFKSINDRFGHDTGDRVLIAVSRLLRGTLLPSDEISRWGGDEFAAILYFRTPEDAVATSQRMIDTLEKAPDARGVGASIGLVSIERGKTAVQLMHAADRLMYSAKARGRNRVVTREK